MTAWPKTCRCCGAVIPTEASWKALPGGEEQPIGDVVLEQKECPGGCGSSLVIQIGGPDLDNDISEDAA